MKPLKINPQLFLLPIFCIAFSLIVACEQAENVPEDTLHEVLEDFKAQSLTLTTNVHNEPISNSYARSLIFFASNRKGKTNQTDNWEIWIMNMSEDEQNGVLQITNNDNYDCYWPRVSPDKSKLLFYRTPKGNKESDYQLYSLWIMDLETFEEKELLPLSRYNWTRQGTVAWSPDGSCLVMFARESNNEQSLFITDIAGNILEKINNGDGKYTDPSWSPDGQSICFSKNEEIHTFHLTSNKEQQITCDIFHDFDPFWSPDGTEIAFESKMTLIGNCLILGDWALRSVKVNQVPDNATCNQIKAKTNIIRQKDSEGLAVPRWTNDGKYLLFHYGDGCLPYLALIKRDGTGFYKEKLNGRNYGKTSPDIVEF